MTYEELVKANATIKTTDIKGKDYAEVNQRIKAFRMVHPDGVIKTKLIYDENGVCMFKAFVYDESGNLLGTGHAKEKEASSYINKTSYIENCETSAVGRALGMCGFGIDVSLASYEEVANAINNQDEKPQKGHKAKEEQKPNNDTSEAETQPETEQRTVDSKITISEKDEILKIVNENKIDLNEMCKAFNVDSIKDLTYVNYRQIKKNVAQLKEKFPRKEIPNE